MMVVHRPAARHRSPARYRDRWPRPCGAPGRAARRGARRASSGRSSCAGLRLAFDLLPVDRPAQRLARPAAAGHRLPLGRRAAAPATAAAFGDAPRHLVLPAFALALVGHRPDGAADPRQHRSDLRAATTSRWRAPTASPDVASPTSYAFRPALIPTLTSSGLDFAAMLGNAFLVETVFAWPGMARYGVEVILSKDLNAIVGTVLVIGCRLPDRQYRRRPAGRLHRSAHPPRRAARMTSARAAIRHPRLAPFARNPLSVVGLVHRAAIVVGRDLAPFHHALSRTMPAPVGRLRQAEQAARRRAPASAPTRSAATSSPASSSPIACR